VLTFIRFDMRAPAWGPATTADIHQATLGMSEWADRVGFDTIVVSEHHRAEDGFLPSPIVAAAAIAGRTERAGISISALLAPLHDPIRVAEDLAVLDLMSGGRVITIVGLGYRPEEYEMFGVPWESRGAFFDEWLQALLDAWTGEPFVYRDRKARVTPPPGPDPHPPLFVGGRSRAAARRAARFGLSFFPDSTNPALVEAYEEACRAEGHEPGVVITPEDPVTFVFVHDDPDGYWERIGPHVLHEATTYAGWQQEGETSSAVTDARSIEELKAGDRFAVLTPDEAVARAHERGNLLLYPLCGGIPPELAWESLHLVEHEVLPRVAGS
jgi:alkanesulfonate monooxygenase SsuD/methylene tetrahydromethanopterin reductase-like flavin-dependent oxidoreductase (luciferase family)